MEQGRIAAARAFGLQIESNRATTLRHLHHPEISFIGKTEEQLTEEDAPYEVGLAYYRETARGQIRGDTTGRLKLIFHRETRELLGVHIIGEAPRVVSHRPGRDDPERHRELFRGYRVQLSDPGRML